MLRYRNPDLGLLLIRLGLAVVFLSSSITKMTTLDRSTAFFASIGFTMPLLYIIIVVELISGIVMLLGILPEWGYVIAIEMAVVIIRVRLPLGIMTGYYELMLLLAGLLIALSGPGKYSLFARKDRKRTSR